MQTTFKDHAQEAIKDSIADIIANHAQYTKGDEPYEPAGYYPIDYNELTHPEQAKLTSLLIDSGENWIDYIHDFTPVDRQLKQCLRSPTQQNKAILGDILLKLTVEAYGNYSEELINDALSQLDEDNAA